MGVGDRKRFGCGCVLNSESKGLWFDGRRGKERVLTLWGGYRSLVKILI